MAADPTKLKLVKEVRHPGHLFSLARVPQTNRILFGASDGGVYDVDLATEKPTPAQIGKHESYVTGLAMAGRQAVSSSYDCRLNWWDVEGRTQVRSIEAHARWIRGVIASPDGKLVASVADDMLAKIWNAENGELVQTLKNHAELLFLAIAAVRALVVYLPDAAVGEQHVWAAHLLVGAPFTLAGLVLLRRARRAPQPVD